MARARLFKPTFFANAKLSEVPAHGRLLFISLWTLADREGRLKDEPRVIKGATFPFENVNVDKLLTQLKDLGFIQRYTVGGEGFVQITNFKKHQRPHQNEPESSLPPMYEVDNADGDPSTTPTSLGSNSSSGNGSGSKSKDGDEDAAFGAPSVVRLFEQAFARLLSPMEIELIKALEEEHPTERIEYAIREASSLGKRNLRYIQRICERQANGDTDGADSRFQATGSNSGSVAGGVSDMERRLAYVASLGREGES